MGRVCPGAISELHVSGRSPKVEKGIQVFDAGEQGRQSSTPCMNTALDMPMVACVRIWFVRYALYLRKELHAGV